MNYRKTGLAVLYAALLTCLAFSDASAAPSQMERVGALIIVSDLDVSLDFFARLAGLKEARQSQTNTTLG